HVLTQSLTIDKLGRNKVAAVGLADLMDGQDVVMVKGRDGASLLSKAAQSFLISGELGRKQLEGDLAAQLGIFREIDFTHATFAEQTKNLVAAEPLAFPQLR